MARGKYINKRVDVIKYSVLYKKDPNPQWVNFTSLKKAGIYYKIDYTYLKAVHDGTIEDDNIQIKDLFIDDRTNNGRKKGGVAKVDKYIVMNKEGNELYRAPSLAAISKKENITISTLWYHHKHNIISDINLKKID